MGHKILEKMKYKNTNKLMIVAHADDEVIWAGEKLLKEKGQWDILCVVTPDHLSKFRIPIFEYRRIRTSSSQASSFGCCPQCRQTGLVR